MYKLFEKRGEYHELIKECQHKDEAVQIVMQRIGAFPHSHTSGNNTYYYAHHNLDSKPDFIIEIVN